MKKIKMVARAMIINPETNRIYTDEGLRALDGYFEDIVEVEDDYDASELVSSYEELYPELAGRDFQIIDVV